MRMAPIPFWIHTTTDPERPGLSAFLLLFFFISLFVCTSVPVFDSICMALFRDGSGGDTTMCEKCLCLLRGGDEEGGGFVFFD